jgi:hypothetical protein
MVAVRPRFTSFHASLLATLGLATVIGCGPRQARCYPVSGIVTVAGQPAHGAVVTLHPQSNDAALEKLRPHGTVGRDGRFELSCYGRGDGAPAGEYKVTIVWEVGDASPDNRHSEDPESLPEAPDRLQGRYRAAETTPLRATIVKGENNLEPFAL